MNPINKNILVVEDDDVLRMSLEIALQSSGYRVTTACDGQEAFALFQKTPQQFALIFTDLEMPGMNGDELAYKIYGMNMPVPIILSTGTQAVNLHSIQKWKIQSVLLKPYPFNLLLNRIEHLTQ